MRKQRLISAALALLLALSLCACEGGKPEPGTTGTTAAEEPGTTAPAGPLSVVSAGKSDYAILYDPTDTRAGTLAKAFQNALMKQCGVMLPLRTVPGMKPPTQNGSWWATPVLRQATR